jgi:chorismate synthase
MTRFDTPKGSLEIRELSSIADMVAAEKIQLQVWGAGIIPTPKEMLIPIQHEGGLLAGALTQAGEMVGMVFGFPTRDQEAMHSQILGTLEEWRGLGIGARLKWFQRDWCLERGIQQVRWTVDPLRAANAELNIRHLGGTASTYLPDYYGEMQGIDAGAPTDRLLVEWHLSGQRTVRLVDNSPPDLGFPHAEPINAVEGGRPSAARYDLACSQLLLCLPENFMQLSRVHPEQALEWRLHTRELLLHYFNRGYMITGFTRVDSPAYLLEKRMTC